MNTLQRPATRMSNPPVQTTSAATVNVHERASLEGLDVTPLRFELWLLAGGDRRSARRPKNLQA